MRRASVPAVCAVAALLLGAALPASAASPGDRGGTIVVGSKNFEESRLLGEMFAQLIEARTGLHAERRLGLAGTQVCFEALRSGAIDVYPEYTGTGLVSILHEAPAGGAKATLARVRGEFLSRFDLGWIAPLGFENAYEVAVPRALARREHLATLSDLVRIGPRLRAAFGPEFIARADGLPGLRRTYGLDFASVQAIQETLKYQAAKSGQIDVLDVYTTDSRLILYDLVVLRDDRGFFPPYEAAPLVRGATLRRHPELAAALSLLGGAFDEEGMRRLNLRLQEGKETESVVARDALRALGLVGGSTQARQQATRAPGLWDYLWGERQALGRRTLTHLALSAIALLLGVLIAVPLGLYLERHAAFAEPVIGAFGLLQTVPSLALLAFLVPLLGVGPVPAIASLFLYSLFPIVRNTYTGVRDADPKAVDAATALGMTPGQVLRQVRLPLAAPVLMAGIRTAAVITVGTATLAAFIGAGGLGEPIVIGLQLANNAMILSGAIPAALLALAVDFGLGRLEAAIRPPGLEVHR